MKRRMDWIQSITASLLTTIALILVFVVVSLGVIEYQGKNFEVFSTIFSNLWPLYVSILILLFIITLFFFRFTRQFLSISLLIVSFFLIVASFKQNPLSSLLRNFIEPNIDVNYLAFGATLSALLLAIFSRRNSDSNDSDLPK